MRRILVNVALVVTLLLVLVGCSQRQQVIFDALMNVQNANSLQDHTTITMQLTGTGFEPWEQEQIDEVAALVNSAKLTLDTKSMSNEQQTIAKAEAEIRLDAQEFSVSLPFWVDMDLSGDTLKMKEIFKFPSMFPSMLPEPYDSKEYMVMDMFNASDSEYAGMDMQKLAEFTKSMTEAYISFIESYAKSYSPQFDVESLGGQTIQTYDGAKQADVYRIKLNDAQYKELIRYSVTNFAQNPEAMNFIKEIVISSIDIVDMPQADKEEVLAELETGFVGFEGMIPQFLTQFDAVMDKIDEVKILGDKGFELEFAIADGYLIQQKGSLNFSFDIAQIAELFGALFGSQLTSPGGSTAIAVVGSPDGPTSVAGGIEAKGVLDLQFNFQSDTFNINSPLEIQIPEVNSENSFSYFDFLQSMMSYNPVHEEEMRLAGWDRYQTALVIGENLAGGLCENIILVSGENYTDALSSSILSAKFEAPVLLVASTPEQSAAAWSYIDRYADADTKIYIVGGTETIGPAFETELRQRGLTNIERLSGYDRYDTNMAVVEKVNAAPGTPVFIVSGETVTDALSVASVAAFNQYPVLLVEQNNLSDKVKNYLSQNAPSSVYIVGGVFAVSQAVEDQIKELATEAAFKRLAGNDRFATSGAIAAEFADDPYIVYLANGFNYYDALIGGSLAAQFGAPVLLIDNNAQTLPPAVEAYLQGLRSKGSYPIVFGLGGEAVVPNTLIQQAERILAGE